MAFPTRLRVGGSSRVRPAPRAPAVLGALGALFLGGWAIGCGGDGERAESPEADVVVPVRGESDGMAERLAGNRLQGAREDPEASLLTTLAELGAHADRTRLEPASLQRALGDDPAVLVRYVADEILYEPYRGVLRGAKGTLMARSGNAVDRALLLGALLRSAGFETRLTAGRLTPGQAATLVRRSLDARLGPAAEPASADLVFVEAIADRAWDHFVLLEEALHESGVDPDAHDGSAWRDALEAAEQHVWVQYRQGDRWEDADPTPGLALGTTLTAAEATFTDPVHSDIHRVRLVVEILDSGSVGSDIVLEWEEVAMDLVGRPLGLYFERDGPRATPVLLIAGRKVRGSAFEVVGYEAGEERRPAGGPAGMLGGAMGALGGRRSEEPPPPGEPSIRGSLHVTSFGPSGERRGTVRLFPGVPGRLGNLSGGTRDGTPGSHDGLEGVWGLSVSVGRVPGDLPLTLLSELGDPFTREGVAHVLGVLAAQYRFLRDLAPASFLEGDPLVYVDRPNVVVAALHPAPHDGLSLSLDLSLKGYRWLRLPEDPEAEYGLFYDGLVNGVLDHTVERAFAAATGEDRSLGALLEQALEEDIAVLAIPPGGSVRGVELGEEGRERLRSALEAGFAAVLPGARPAAWAEWEMAWWQVDRATGWTEDVTEAGHGQALFLLQGAAEQTALQQRRPEEIVATQRLACFAATLVTVASWAVSVAPYAGAEFGPAGELAENVLDIAGDVVNRRCPAPVRRPTVDRRRDPFFRDFPQKKRDFPRGPYKPRK